MRSIRTSRAALGAVALALTLVFGVCAGGAAQANTNPPGSTCAEPNYPGICSYNSGWFTYGDGSCEADVSVEIFTAENYINNITVEESSPYLFAGCTAWVTAHFQTDAATGNQVYSSGAYYGYACSETDPTCKYPHSDPGIWTYGPVSDGIPSSTLAADVDWIWVTAQS